MAKSGPPSSVLQSARIARPRSLLKADADVSIYPKFALAVPEPIVGDKPALGQVRR
jgi:hypothetical protein